MMPKQRYGGAVGGGKDQSVWNVAPPQYARGRRAGPSSEPPFGVDKGKPSRAPSPLLPRIGRGSDPATANGSGVISELMSRLSMLEERVSNVDYENAVLRKRVENQDAQLQRRLDDSNAQVMTDVKRLFKLEVDTSALQRTVTESSQDMAARVAALETAVRHDERLLQQMRDQWKVELSQGVRRETMDAADAGIQSAVAAATDSARAAAEAHNMLAELRAGLRSKESEDATNRRLLHRKLEVMAAELERVSGTVVDVTTMVTRTREQMATIASAAGVNSGESAEASANVHSQMQALTKYMRMTLEEVRGGLNARMDQIQQEQQQQQGSSADAASNEAVAMLQQQVNELRDALEREAQARKDAEAYSTSLVEEMRSLMQSAGDGQQDQLNSLVKKISEELVSERRRTLQELQDARDALDTDAAKRIQEEGAAFDTISKRFQTVEDALRQEHNTQEGLSQVVTQLLQQAQSEAAERQGDVAAMRKSLDGMHKEIERALSIAASTTEKDNEVLTKLVHSEIELRVKGEATTVAALKRYVEGLTQSVARVRDGAAEEAAALRSRIEQLQDAIVKRMSSNARKSQGDIQGLVLKMQQEVDELRASFDAQEAQQKASNEAFRHELKSAWEAQMKNSNSKESEAMQQARELVSSMKREMQDELKNEWASRESQMQELAASIDRSSASNIDAITALQAVQTEDRDRMAASLAALDSQLTAKIAQSSATAAEALNKVETDCWEAIDALREAADENEKTGNERMQELAANMSRQFDMLSKDGEASSAARLSMMEEVTDMLNTAQDDNMAAVEALQGEVEELKESIMESMAHQAAAASLAASVAEVESQLGSEMLMKSARSESRDAVRAAMLEMKELRTTVAADIEAMKQQLQQQHASCAEQSSNTDRRAKTAIQSIDSKYKALNSNLELRLAQLLERSKADRAAIAAVKAEAVAAATLAAQSAAQSADQSEAARRAAEKEKEMEAEAEKERLQAAEAAAVHSESKQQSSNVNSSSESNDCTGYTPLPEHQALLEIVVSNVNKLSILEVAVSRVHQEWLTEREEADRVWKRSVALAQAFESGSGLYPVTADWSNVQEALPAAQVQQAQWPATGKVGTAAGGSSGGGGARHAAPVQASAAGAGAGFGVGAGAEVRGPLLPPAQGTGRQQQGAGDEEAFNRALISSVALVPGSNESRADLLAASNPASRATSRAASVASSAADLQGLTPFGAATLAATQGNGTPSASDLAASLVTGKSRRGNKSRSGSEAASRRTSEGGVVDVGYSHDRGEQPEEIATLFDDNNIRTRNV